MEYNTTSFKNIIKDIKTLIRKQVSYKTSSHNKKGVYTNNPELAGDIVDSMNAYLSDEVEENNLLPTDGSSELYDIMYQLLNALENLKDGEPTRKYAVEILGYVDILERGKV